MRHLPIRFPSFSTTPARHSPRDICPIAQAYHSHRASNLIPACFHPIYHSHVISVLLPRHTIARRYIFPCPLASARSTSAMPACFHPIYHSHGKNVLLPRHIIARRYIFPCPLASARSTSAMPACFHPIYHSHGKNVLLPAFKRTCHTMTYFFWRPVIVAGFFFCFANFFYKLS